MTTTAKRDETNCADFAVHDAGMLKSTTIEFFPLTERGRNFLSADKAVASLTIKRSRAYDLIDEAGATGITWYNR